MRLKVLTIANELLYDEAACQAFASKAAFLNLDKLDKLDHDQFHHDNGYDKCHQLLDQDRHDQLSTRSMAIELAIANANILASEISRRLASVAVHSGCLMPGLRGIGPGSSQWLSSVARTPERQDVQLEPQGWSRTRSAIQALDLSLNSTATTADAVTVLDQTYRSLELTTHRILKLQDANEAVDADFKELTESFLSSASLIRSSALEWKCKVVDSVDATTASASNQLFQLKELKELKVSKDLGRFLGRAISVGDSLNACLAVLLARRV
eukprot:Skav209681  [mRNA]  locus=scaffold1603:158837:159643:- [translate_table: standard]